MSTIIYFHDTNFLQSLMAHVAKHVFYHAAKFLQLALKLLISKHNASKMQYYIRAS